MPHSLRAKLSGLRYKQIISSKDYDRLCKALDNENVLDKIRNDFIDRYPRNYANELELGGRSCVFSLNDVLQILDKYKTKSKDIEVQSAVEYCNNEYEKE